VEVPVAGPQYALAASRWHGVGLGTEKVVGRAGRVLVIDRVRERMSEREALHPAAAVGCHRHYLATEALCVAESRIRGGIVVRYIRPSGSIEVSARYMSRRRFS